MNRRPAAQGGMTLIEVLVSILIFSFGLLGFVGLQARAIQYSVSAENSNRAALYANEVVTAIALSGANPTSSAALAAAVTAWQNGVTAVMGPNSTATVSVTSPTQATVRVTWRATSTRAGTANPDSQYVTQVTLP